MHFYQTLKGDPSFDLGLPPQLISTTAMSINRMKSVVEKFGDEETRKDYEVSSHSALGDVEALRKICQSPKLKINFTEFLKDRDRAEIDHDLMDLGRQAP